MVTQGFSPAELSEMTLDEVNWWAKGVVEHHKQQSDAMKRESKRRG